MGKATFTGLYTSAAFRRCTRCNQAKQVKGGTVKYRGKGFVCADCKPKPVVLA